MAEAKEYRFNNSTVRIVFGDILDSHAEVIVSSDDTMLTMGGGLSGHILDIGGPDIERQTSKFVPVAIGDVAVTSAGNLPQKYIFHAVTLDRCDPGYASLPVSDVNDVYSYIIGRAIKKCFALMRTLDIRSIAFPCIGAGSAGIPYDEVAKRMAKTIGTMLMNTNKAISVEVWLLDRYGNLSDFGFLSFFEWFAAYSLLSRRELEGREVIAPESFDYSGVHIDDRAADDPEASDFSVFISYSRKDAEMARGICTVLNDIGVPYWIDVDGVYSGANFKEVIVRAIAKAEIVIFLSSHNSNASSNVAKEIGIADKYNKVIIPVRIDDSPFNPKMEYDLSSIDSVDFISGDDKSLKKLKNAIQAQLTIARSRK